MWQKLKNKFWVCLSLINICFLSEDTFDMYYHFNRWGGEGFPAHYASRNIYVYVAMAEIVFFIGLLVWGVWWQNKHSKISSFLLMFPLYFWIAGVLYWALQSLV